jgi:hypothetical protein
VSNHRIRIKRAKQFGERAVDAYSLDEILAHAKPSLHALPRRQRCACVFDAAHESWGLGLTARAAKRIQRLALSELPIAPINRSVTRQKAVLVQSEKPTPGA